MSIYKVTISIGSYSYDIEAPSEDIAIEVAKDMLYDEPMFDLLDELEFDVEEIK